MTSNILFQIEAVTDTETGNEQIGDVDFALMTSNIQKYLKQYGREGYMRIVAMTTVVLNLIEDGLH